MSKYIGPNFKIIRRLGFLNGLITIYKYNLLKYIYRDIVFYKKKSKYLIRLEEKQKLRFNYGITEKQLIKYIHKLKIFKEEYIILKFIEMRLDNIIFKLGISSTIYEAKQLINHKHINNNNNTISIPSYFCKYNNNIIFNKKSNIIILNNFYLIMNKKNYKFFYYLNFNNKIYTSYINNILYTKWIDLKIIGIFIYSYYFT
uniref:ribosomal protein S4 n=1 Tax=Pogoniopsis schenckii TaxID=1582014 RepID=UPI002236FC50|nr:ribosomal protein S4 [Pogoniopsis schenckii]UYP51002.1 ribosomal protein S4 [Pogoniopsis schenckii]